MVPVLICAIVAGVQVQLTSDPTTRSQDLIVTKFAGTFNGFLSIFPLLFLLFLLVKFSSEFKKSSNRRRLLIVLVSTLLIGLEQIVKVIVAYKSLAQIAWIISKPAFYCLNAVLEICTSAWLAAMNLHASFGLANPKFNGKEPHELENREMMIRSQYPNEDGSTPVESKV